MHTPQPLKDIPVGFGPRTVSGLGLLLVILMATAAGLLGNRLVVGSLQETYYRHSAEQSQRLAEGLRQMLTAAFADAGSVTEALTRFRLAVPGYERTGEVAVYLIDAARPAVIPITPGSVAGELSLQDLPPRAPGWLVHAPEDGPADLTYLLPGGEQGEASRWQLAIRTDISGQMDAMHRLHYQLSSVLLLVVGLIALGSFHILRRLGRGYERQLEQALARRTRELQAAHAQVMQQDRLATIGRTASVLAHEIRNPLASIKFGLSGIARADYLPERDARRLDIVLREVDRLSGMLSGTLNYVRPIRLSDAPVAIEPLLENVLLLVAPLLEERRLTLRREIGAALPPLRMDVGQMEQVLLNLLKNAIEASPPGAEVSLSAEHRAPWLQLEVHNFGPEIPEPVRSHLFEPFQTTKPRGTGLGLMHVKRVVEEHGGEVYAQSSAEHGTRFGLRLPLTPPDTASP